MFLKYERKEMLLDNKPDDGVMVVNVNAQGILEIDKVSRRLAKEFPEIEMQYRAACHQGQMGLGSIRLFESGKHRIMLICTAYNIIGMTKDDEEVIVHTTTKIIDELGKKYSNFKFTSGILNRGIADWTEVYKALNQSGLKWQVFTE